jgi:hypothetical protein
MSRIYFSWYVAIFLSPLLSTDLQNKLKNGRGNNELRRYMAVLLRVLRILMYID